MREKILLLGATGLVGQWIAGSLGDSYQIIPAAGHCKPEDGYRLTAEDPCRLVEILDREDPEIVISSIRGSYPAQMRFHRALADWLARKGRRLLYMSTANVFDGSLSQPWREGDPPVPVSDYGCFKRDCEVMLEQLLGRRLAVFRLAAAWSADCPRVQRLRHYSSSEEPYSTYPDYTINVTLAEQIGAYAGYVLEKNLHGVFHVGTRDMVNYSVFERQVCQALGIKPPCFAPETTGAETFFAVLPAREEIPDELQMTVADVLSALKITGKGQEKSHA